MIPQRIRPRIAGLLFLSTTTPMRLRINPSGVRKTMPSPPRAEIGLPQPGRSRHIVATMAKAMMENTRPIRPTLAAGLSWIGVCRMGG